MSSMSLITILLFMSSVQNNVLKIQKVEWAVVQPDRGGGVNSYILSSNLFLTVKVATLTRIIF